MANIIVDYSGSWIEAIKQNDEWVIDNAYDTNADIPSVGDTLTFTGYRVPPYDEGPSIATIMYTSYKGDWMDCGTSDYSEDLDAAMASGAATFTVTEVIEDDGSYKITMVLGEPGPEPTEEKALGGNSIAFLKEKMQEMVSASGIVDLTSDDYNYPTNSPDGVSLWDKPIGIYRTNDLTKVYFGTVDNSTTKGLFFVFPGDSSNVTRIFRMDAYSAAVLDYSIVTSTGAFITRRSFIESNNVVDNLTSTSTTSPLSANQGKVLKDAIDAGLTILSYGNSTWQDFLNAYNANKIVYCRASSSANPATGSQTRMAFMAYVSNPSTPTSVEFQYVRSVNNKSASAQVDQVFVYKLTNANGGTWTVETRDMASTIAAGTGLSSTYSNGTLTLNATGGGGGGGLTTLYYDENDMRFYEDSQFTTVMTVADVVNAIYDGVVFVKFRENGGYSQTKMVCAAYGPTTVTAANASEWKAATMDGSNYNPEPLFISTFADNTFQFGT